MSDSGRYLQRSSNKTPNNETPDRIFTLAQNDDGGPALLFTRRDKDAERLGEDIKEVLPHLEKTIPFAHVYPRELGDYPIWVVSNGIGNEVLDVFENATEADNIYVYKNQQLHTLKLQDIYYGCQLPNRTLVGCKECIFEMEASDRDCELKQLFGYQDLSRFDPKNHHTLVSSDDVKNTLRNRKTVIGGFTYISPRLTQVYEFTRTLRGIDEHDFNQIEVLSNRFSSSAKERNRRQRFEQHTCANCFVQPVCWQSKWCQGAYPKTEEEVAEIINKQIKTIYTDEQIAYLLYNSGELPKRVLNNIGFATFTTDANDRLNFKIVRRRSPHAVLKEFDSFEAAKQFLKDHGRAYEPRCSSPISKIMKATLSEAGRYTYSPRRSCGFGMTTYPTVGLTEYADTIQFHFLWNSRRTMLPWHLRVDSIMRIFEAYGTLYGVQRSHSEYARDNYAR